MRRFPSILIGMLLLALTFLVRAQTTPPAPHPAFVGDAACQPCHRQTTEEFHRTSHHLTSQLPSTATILGSLTPPANVLPISSPTSADPETPRLLFEMAARDGRFWQTAVAENGAQRLTRTEPIDLVVGSGTRGQTYLYWSGNQLFELPVSFWTDGHRWINSPGYRDGTANLARRADPRCLECHATAIQPLSSDLQTNLYDRSTLVPGISCESCHGPGAEHVRLERLQSSTHPNPTPTPDHAAAARAILDPAHLPRDREIDQCALCHNGTARRQLAPAFSYVPGQLLDRYLAPATLDPTDYPDVHGNQVGLLERSRCFRSSPNMTCSTCHDVHAPERTAASYSPRCLSCHAWQSCGRAKLLGPRIQSDCVTCHMPVQPTPSIVSTTAGETVRATIRTHWIQVYPSAN